MGFKATADNIAYTAHFVRPIPPTGGTSYILGTLSAIAGGEKS